MEGVLEGSLVEQLASLVDGCDGSTIRRYCHLSNASALLAEYLQDINWVGFYLVDESGENLVLGPFQGKVACTDIPFTRGVCGSCARTRKTVRVGDVHAFAGHIACDSASNSELVIPLIDPNGTLVGVLDIDSPLHDRFSEEDQKLLEACVSVLATKLYS